MSYRSKAAAPRHPKSPARHRSLLADSGPAPRCFCSVSSRVCRWVVVCLYIPFVKLLSRLIVHLTRYNNSSNSNIDPEEGQIPSAEIDTHAALETLPGSDRTQGLDVGAFHLPRRFSHLPLPDHGARVRAEGHAAAAALPRSPPPPGSRCPGWSRLPPKGH